MLGWPCNPRIYEINTWVWLSDLSYKLKHPITLHNVPDSVLDEVASYHVDAIWLMGVWYRGPSTRASATNYIHEYVSALPDITEDDVVGSAYAIGAYEVEAALGGDEGMASFRDRLHERGLRLILDFVPNHTGLDHHWLMEHPEYFIQGDEDLLESDPDDFFVVATETNEDIVVAHGRDPYFPSWLDTAQLNAFSQGYRDAALQTLSEIAELADGVRCDMAMLVMNEIFQRTWGWQGLDVPEVEFWQDVIPQIKQQRPDFIFIAEVYWGMNYALHQQGFDFTYDKTMYDRLRSGDVNGIYAHLGADVSFLNKNIRFIENHDEPRVAEEFGIDKSRPAAVLISTIPGATLLHDGQFIGRKVKLPVQINRQPYERKYPALERFYMRLLREVDNDVYREGNWQLFRCYAACEGCEGDYNLITYGWHLEEDYRLIVLNLSDEWSQALVDLSSWGDYLAGCDWRLLDILHQSFSEEDGDALAEQGLMVDLNAYQALIYHLMPMKKRKRKIKRMQSKA